MKKLFARIVSVVLAVILLTCADLALVADAATTTVDLPIVHVPGRRKTIYNSSGEVIFPLPTSVAKQVSNDKQKIINSFTKSIASDNWSILGDTLYDSVVPLFKDLALSADGTIDNGSYTKPYPVPKEKKSDYVYTDYTFDYDWRLDPIEIAKDLDEFINKVLRATGKKKVQLVSRCLGTSITLAYLTVYGGSKVESCVFYAGAFNGIIPLSTLFSGHLQIDPETLSDYASSTTATSDIVDVDLIKTASKILNSSPTIASLVEEHFDEACQQILPDILIETYATMPGYWSMVNDQYYEEAKNFIFSGKENIYSELIKKIDYYHYNVQNKLTSTLLKLQKQGVKISNIVKYNYSFSPIYENANKQSDDTIEVDAMSLGATVALKGKTLSAAQLSVADSTYVSKDKIIDSSTCLFPDTTWYLRDCDHSTWPKPVYEFIMKILKRKSQYTIKTSSEYPQYLRYNSVDDTLSPVTSPTADMSVTTLSATTPKTPRISSKTGNTIDLTWTALSNVTGYRIYSYNSSSKKYSVLATVPTNTNKATIKGLKAGTTYSIAVRGYKNANNKTYWTNYSNLLTTATAPAKPTGLKSEMVSPTSVKLSWNAVNGAVGYAVYKYNSSTRKYTKLLTTTATTVTRTGLSVGGSCKYAVKAYITAGSSTVYSDYSSVITAYARPSVPTSLKASAMTADSITLTWDKVSGANGYIVYQYNSSTKAYQQIGTVTGNKVTVKSLKNGTTYYFKVKAYNNEAGKFLYSDLTAKYKTTTAPSAPTIKVTSASSGKATVSWSKVTGATSYTVYYSTSRYAKQTKLGTTTGTSYTKSGFTGGKTYYFTVVAERKLGSTTVSSAKSAMKYVKIKK